MSDRNGIEAQAMRDVSALRSELASIAIMLQERGRIGDLGGPNYALVAGAVLTYVLELEVARDAFADLMDDGLSTAITEMARWDAEALQAENERLRAALEQIRLPAEEALRHLDKSNHEVYREVWDNLRAALYIAMDAAAAVSTEPPTGLTPGEVLGKKTLQRRGTGPRPADDEKDTAAAVSTEPPHVSEVIDGLA